MLEQTIKEMYFDYLCCFVNKLVQDSDDLVDNSVFNYRMILRILHETEFYSVVKNDENREEDGKMLRETFAEMYPEFGNYDDIQGPCTVLEMMIGLAYRMGFIIDKRLYYCFFILINNLFLSKNGSPVELKPDKNGNLKIEFSEESMDYEAEIREIVRKMVARQYDKKGNGGLFPIKKTRKDQRNVEIWYQMMTFLSENLTLFDRKYAKNGKK